MLNGCGFLNVLDVLAQSHSDLHVFPVFEGDVDSVGSLAQSSVLFYLDVVDLAIISQVLADCVFACGGRLHS